jgi:hypothetical protein
MRLAGFRAWLKSSEPTEGTVAILFVKTEKWFLKISVRTRRKVHIDFSLR